MQLDVKSDVISDGLLQQVHGKLMPVHNFVAIAMKNISRRIWSDLLGGLREAVQFRRVGQASGCTYGLADGTFAERRGGELVLFTSTNVQTVPLKVTCTPRKGVFTDIPTATQHFATVTHLTAEQQQPCKVVTWQYFTEIVFANSRGYEYVLRIDTPPTSASGAEVALNRCELQRSSFTVRFAVTTLEHSAVYHAINILHLFQQVFNSELCVTLSEPSAAVGTAASEISEAHGGAGASESSEVASRAQDQPANLHRVTQGGDAAGQTPGSKTLERQRVALPRRKNPPRHAAPSAGTQAITRE